MQGSGMFDWSKFVNLIKANVLNVFTPIIVLFILSRYTSKMITFIGGYALILVLTAIIDFVIVICFHLV